MKLWLLRPIEGKDDMFGWDCNWGFVIAAKTEQDARLMASQESGGENYTLLDGVEFSPWLKEDITTCRELTDNEEEGVILVDFHA